MSSLQIGLAMAGGLVLAGVVVHGTWTSRRNAPKQPLPAPRPPEIPRPEPLPEEPFERREPMFDSGLAPLAVPERRPSLDALIDVITPIALESPVLGDAVLAALPPTRRAGSKPFAIEGLNDATGQWEVPAPGHAYSAFQSGVQLANRTGALNEIEYSEYVMKTQAFADAVNGTPEFPEMRDEVNRARELDQFASNHDAQLGFTLRARSAAWSPGYVQQHASRLGFVSGALPGRMVLPAGAGGPPPILGLSFDAQAALSEDPAKSALYEVSLSLDVPQVDRREQPFARLRAVAQTLGEAMDGLITDDHGQELTPEVMEGIGADLERLYDTLDARDLSAGSPQARRLFA